MEFHPLANVFPLIEGDEFAALQASIKENGLREAIVLFEDKVLDGRNRLRACEATGIDPRFETYEGDQPIAYVIDKNIHRRHLNASQRAMIAGKLSALSPQSPRDQREAIANKFPIAEISATGVEEAARMLNVHRDSVSDAKLVLAKATQDEIAEVVNGQRAVSTLASQIRRGEKELGRQNYKPEQKRNETKQFNAQLWHQFKDALTNITGMPHVEDAVRIIRAHDRAGYVDERLSNAVTWIKEFSDAWNSDRT